MRLFAAILPPDPVSDALATAVASLHALPGAERLRWTRQANWHLTLAFYGEVTDDTVPELHERLARAAHRGQPLDLRLAGAGRFGDRALWADVAGDRDALTRLARTSHAAGRRGGIAVDEARRFRAHLSLAHARRGGDGAPATDLRPFVTALAEFQGATWTASELALVRSNLPTSGVPGEQPRYETLAAWPLGH